MPYCVAADVRRIIDTDLGDADIIELITLADQEITDRALSRTTATLKRISMLLTGELIAIRRFSAKSIGEYREEVRGPEDYRRLAEKTINDTGDVPFLSYNEPIE